VFLSQEPDNGYILRDESSKNLTVGSIVKFKCRLGYILHGSNISTCREDGQWSYENTTCARKYHRTALHHHHHVMLFGVFSCLFYNGLPEHIFPLSFFAMICFGTLFFLDIVS
jgi:hypothetical protein